MKYIQYSRKSTEAKERQALSIEEQNSECLKCADRENLNIILKLQESKSSFKPHNRPQFDRMIEVLQLGQADAILTWKPDRLCRNPEEGGKLLQMLQDGVIKEIRTAMGDVYTQESDHLVLQIHFGMANQYSRNLSQNVKRGISYKRERGEYTGPAPICYENFGERGKRNIRPISWEANLLKEAIELMKTGKYSLGYLVNYLYDKGLRPKRGFKISKSHLYRILTNPVLYGCFISKGELYQGNFEGIICKDSFDELQEAINGRSKPKVKSHGHWINGLIKCPDCGCSITTTVKEKYYKGTNRNAEYSYHHCTHRKGECEQKAITSLELENELEKNIDRIVISEDIWNLGMELFRSKHKEESEKNSEEFDRLQRMKDVLEKRLYKIIEMRTNDELTKEEFIEQKNIIVQEKTRINGRLNDHDSSVDNWLELSEKFLNNAFYARKIIKGGDSNLKRKFLIDVSENLYLKDKKLVFSFKKPYDILLKAEYRSNVLGD